MAARSKGWISGVADGSADKLTCPFCLQYLPAQSLQRSPCSGVPAYGSGFVVALGFALWCCDAGRRAGLLLHGRCGCWRGGSGCRRGRCRHGSGARRTGCRRAVRGRGGVRCGCCPGGSGGTGRRGPGVKLPGDVGPHGAQGTLDAAQPRAVMRPSRAARSRSSSSPCSAASAPSSLFSAAAWLMLGPGSGSPARWPDRCRRPAAPGRPSGRRP